VNVFSAVQNAQITTLRGELSRVSSGDSLLAEPGG
jgi:hypothetical protein